MSAAWPMQDDWDAWMASPGGGRLRLPAGGRPSQPERGAIFAEARHGQPLAWVYRPDLKPKTHTVEQVCRVLRISRAMFWKLARDGRLVVAKIERQTLVSDIRLRMFMDSLEREAA